MGEREQDDGIEHRTADGTKRDTDVPTAPAGPQDPPADPAEPMNPA